MADLFSMLVNGRVVDVHGYEISDVVAISVMGGKLLITIDLEEEEDEDDPAREPKPEMEFPKFVAAVSK